MKIKLQHRHSLGGLICSGIGWEKADNLLHEAGLVSYGGGGWYVLKYEDIDRIKAVLRLNGFEVEE